MLALLLFPPSSFAQTVTDAHVVDFYPSADNSTLLAGGTPAVSEYDFNIYVAGGTTPVYTLNMGKPSAQSDGMIHYDFSSTISQWAASGVTYESRVGAVGPNGTSLSGTSNTFTVTTSQCAFTVSPTSISVGSASGTTSVTVTTTAGCGWTASSGASWITVSPASGTANGTVTLTFTANTTTSTRSGTVTVAGQTVTVTQAAAACAFTVSPTSISVGSASGTASVTVTTTTGCAWTASSGASWITVMPASGTASGTVMLTFTANTTTSTRSGTVTVAGQTVTVTQAAAACTFTVSPTSISVGSASGTTSVTVTTTAGCAWTASSGASWITVSPASGTASGTVTLTFTANTTTSTRSGTVTVAGQTVTVTQAAGSGCTYTVSPLTLSVGTAAGRSTLSVTTTSSCSWTATSNASWITLQRTSGSGSRTDRLAYSANKGAARVGTVTVAGQTVTVSQAGTAALTVRTEQQLQTAVASATSDTTIAVEPGTYRLTRPLRIHGANNVTLRGATGNRNEVILAGPGMASRAGMASGVWTDSSGFTLADLTLRDFPASAVSFGPGAKNPRLSNLRVADAEYLVRAERDGVRGGVNGGVVERSVLEFTTTGRDGLTRGIEIQSGNGWIVRNNIFRNIRAPRGAQGWPALLAWNGSANTVVDGNRFVNCQRGIALGAVNRDAYDHVGGVIRNNVVYSAAGQSRGGFGISVTNSPSTEVLNNTVVLSGTDSVSIMLRGPATNGLVANNLTDSAISQREGAIGMEYGNDASATVAMFVNAAAGDLHLLPTATGAIDAGILLDEVTVDLDGRPRSAGVAPDIGAYELQPR